MSLTEDLVLFKSFDVQSYRGSYSVDFTSIQSELPNQILLEDVVLVDSNILKIFPSISEVLKNYKIIIIEASEEAKSYDAIGMVIKEIIETGFSKNNRLIAIGGGITQDITSFAASILFRGVDWIFFPTNLATQADSCIGSKTSVNFGSYKNQLGGFHPPRKIFIDFSFCNTLPLKEICAGLGEMMHYFMVDGKEDLTMLFDKVKAAKHDKNVLADLVRKSLLIKKSMIEIDEFDIGPRNVFNYGHTFGHAIEAATSYAIPHGIAVAYGIDLANIISVRRGLIDIELRNKIRNILDLLISEVSLPSIDIDIYFKAISRDKKNIGSDVNVILTRGLGNMFKTKLDMTKETTSLIEDFFYSKLYQNNL